MRFSKKAKAWRIRLAGLAGNRDELGRFEPVSASEEKLNDVDLVCEMIGITVERLMELEVEGLTGAASPANSCRRMREPAE